jgi:hypothetical protein
VSREASCAPHDALELGRKQLGPAARGAFARLIYGRVAVRSARLVVCRCIAQAYGTGEMPWAPQLELEPVEDYVDEALEAYADEELVARHEEADTVARQFMSQDL